MDESTANPNPEAVTEDPSATAQIIDESGESEVEQTPEPQLPPVDEIEDEFEGRKYKIPKAWRDARLMHADYTRKTMELAEQRKQAETWKQQQEQFFSKHREAAALEHEVSQYKDVNWYDAIARAGDDATKNQIRDLWLQVQTRQERLKSLTSEIEAERKSEQQQHEQMLSHWTQAGEQFLRQRIKDWGPSKQELVVRTMHEYGVGSTDPRLDKAAFEIAQYHPAIIAAFHDAALYRQSLKKATETKAEVPQPIPAQRIGGSAVSAKSPDKMTTEEWLQWRESGLKKKRAA